MAFWYSQIWYSRNLACNNENILWVNRSGLVNFYVSQNFITQPAFTCPKLTIETLEQGVKYVQS